MAPPLDSSVNTSPGLGEMLCLNFSGKILKITNSSFHMGLAFPVVYLIKVKLLCIRQKCKVAVVLNIN